MGKKNDLEISIGKFDPKISVGSPSDRPPEQAAARWIYEFTTHKL
jgi:hypothetical protein